MQNFGHYFNNINRVFSGKCIKKFENRYLPSLDFKNLFLFRLVFIIFQTPSLHI